jgi:hypothetical protein
MLKDDCCSYPPSSIGTEIWQKIIVTGDRREAFTDLPQNQGVSHVFSNDTVAESCSSPRRLLLFCSIVVTR